MCTPRESELMCNSRNFPPVVAHCMTSQDFSAGCTREFCKSGQLQHAHTYTHTHTHTHRQTHKQTHTLWAIQQPFYWPEEVLQGALSQCSIECRVSDLWPFMLGLVGCFAHVSVVLLFMNHLNSHRDASGYHCWLYLETLIYQFYIYSKCKPTAMPPSDLLNFSLKPWV